MPDLPAAVHALIDLAVSEDVGTGDLTCRLLIPEGREGRGVILARENLVVCGLPVAAEVFTRIDRRTVVKPLVPEGGDAAAGETLATVEGRLASILTGERTALNFLQRLCGVATLSRRFARAAAGRTVVLDSRKTVPGWRWLDKLAVRTGGCQNHRAGLYDGVLIKDNHLRAAGGIRAAVTRALRDAPSGVEVEVEVEDLEGLAEAIDAGAKRIMLDNFPTERLAAAVALTAGRALLEVSGGVTLQNLPRFLDAAKVDFISVGALTHSAPAVDISMEMD